MRHLAYRPARVRERRHVAGVLFRCQLGIDLPPFDMRDDAVRHPAARAPNQGHALVHARHATGSADLTEPTTTCVCAAVAEGS